MDEPLQHLVQRGFRYALSLTHDRPLAEDLVQEAWAAVLAAQGPQTKPYLFRAIRNRWIDRHRRERVVAFEPLAEPADVVDPAHDPRDFDGDALRRALATLRPEEREALFLCVVEGYTAAEVADLTGRPRNTVLSLMHRGRARVREWFAAQQTDEVAP